MCNYIMYVRVELLTSQKFILNILVMEGMHIEENCLKHHMSFRAFVYLVFEITN